MSVSPLLERAFFETFNKEQPNGLVLIVATAMDEERHSPFLASARHVMRHLNDDSEPNLSVERIGCWIGA